MYSSASDPGDAPRGDSFRGEPSNVKRPADAQPPANEDPPADADALDHELLETVLEETLETAGSQDPLDVKELDALVGVPRRHAGRSLEIEPVGIELVQSMFETRFRQASVAVDLWQAMSRRIAETLFESPHARERLTALWARLCEVAG